MGAMAVSSSWNPEDDLLLKNAIEAGASLESLAKGAVCFSRRFTFQELQDRWRSLLYEEDTSIEASTRIIEIELSILNNSKPNRTFSFKGKELTSRKQKTRSLRSHYYAMRKRICSERCLIDDFDIHTPLNACIFDENDGCVENLTLPENKELFGNCLPRPQIIDHFQIAEAGFDIGSDAFPELLKEQNSDATGASHVFQTDHIGSDIVGADGACQPFHTDHIDAIQNKFHGEVFGGDETFEHADNISPMSVDKEAGEDTDHPYDQRTDLKGVGHGFEGSVNPIQDFPVVQEMGPSQALPLSNQCEANHMEAKSLSNFVLDIEGDNGLGFEGQDLKPETFSGGDTFHPVGYSSPLHEMPNWDIENKAHAVASSSMFHEEGPKSMKSPRCANVSAELNLHDEDHGTAKGSEGDFVDISLNFTHDDESYFIEVGDVDDKDMIDRACLDGLNSFLMNSPTDAHEVTAQNLSDSRALAFLDDCHTVSGTAFTRENKDEIQLLRAEEDRSNDFDRASHVSKVSSTLLKSYDPLQGLVSCQLNTEYPEIPCNDHIILPITSGTNLVSDIDLAALGSSNKFSVDEIKSSELVITKEDQGTSTQHASSPKFGKIPISQTGSMHPCHVIRHNLPESVSIAGALRNAGIALKPHIVPPSVSAAAIALMEASPDHEEGESATCDKSTDSLTENKIKGFNSKMSTLNVDDSCKQEMDMHSSIPVNLSSHMELDPEEPFLDQVQPASSSDPEEKFSDNEVPTFSDIEAMMVDMDLLPCDEEPSSYTREVSRYQYLDTKKTIIRLEQGDRSYKKRAIASRGAFAVFRGHKIKYHIRKPEVIIGRSTEEVDVDIDLRKEGRTNKISRRQAMIVMDGGSFSIRNLGKFPVVVNGKDILKGKSCTLSSDCLIEIGHLLFTFEVNQDSMRHYVSKTGMPQSSKFDFL